MRRSGAVDPRPLARMAKRHLRSLRFGLWKTKPEPSRAPVRPLSRAHRPERRDRSENDIGGRLRYQSWQQNNRSTLLELDARTRVFELFLYGFGLVLADVLLHGLRSAIDEVLGLLEAQARDLADGL